MKDEEGFNAQAETYENLVQAGEKNRDAAMPGGGMGAGMYCEVQE